MHSYQDLVRRCLHAGVEKSDRTGTGTRSVFGHQMRFDLSLGFPLVTTKRVPFRSVAAELLWFLSGSTRVQDLRDLGSTIWDEWERPDGTIGPMYGQQWRDISYPWENSVGETFWEHVDQMKELVHGLRNNPDSRRHIVSSWHVPSLPDMALAPCHAMFQCYVANGRLSLQVYQRSADVFLGVPFNIASYAALTMMLAQQCGYELGELIWTGGDCHLYSNHIKQAIELFERDPLPLPSLHINKAPDIFSYKPEDFQLDFYEHHPAIPAPVAV